MKLAALAALAAAVVVWIFVLRTRIASRPHHEPIATVPDHRAAAGKPGTFAVSGIVLDERGQAVGGASVIAGAVVARADAEGAWSIALPAGTYRVFAHGAGVIAVGELRPVPAIDPLTRVPGAIDETLAPALTVTGELHDIELDVVRAATFSGTVTGDRPIAGAIVHALALADRGGRAPVLGTDTAISGSDGRYELQVAPDTYMLEVAHPDFATEMTEPQAAVAATSVDLSLAHKCQLSGRVVDANGAAANDGAIQLADPPLDFGGVGAIRSDGTFRVTAAGLADDVRVRAWPWRSPPSSPKTIRCGPNVRASEIVLTVPVATPSITGAVVDEYGARVPLAPIDVEPLDPLDPLGAPGFAQHERAGADGDYRVFAEPAGTYRVSTSAPGRGFASAIASAPGTRTLVLGGTGRIAGIVAGVGDGSMLVDFATCGSVAIAPDPRIVPIVGGRYTLDGAPACKLSLLASHRGQTTRVDADVKPNQTTLVDVAFTAPLADKLVRGTAGANAEVTARVGDRVVARVTSDADGNFELRAPSGAVIESKHAYASVGFANVGDELVELAVSSK